MDGNLLKWDKVKWEEITEKNKERITDFIIHNYYPKISLTAKTGKTIKVADEKNTVFLILESNKGDVKAAEKIDESILVKDIDKKDSKECIAYSTISAQGPGNRFAVYTRIALILTYFLLFSVVIICSLVQFWPCSAFTNENSKHLVVISSHGSTCAQALTDGKANSSNLPVSSVTFFRWTFPLSDEERLFLFVALAGALGSLVHALRFFYWYAGNRDLVISWLAMYIPLPIIRALLELIFYIKTHGGLLPQGTVQQTRPFAFVAISTLVGLFSVQYALKPRNILHSVFSKASEEQNSGQQVSGRINTIKLRREFNFVEDVGNAK